MQTSLPPESLSLRQKTQRYLQAGGRQLGRLLGWAILLVILAIGSTAGAAALQAGRNETQAADLALVLAAVPPQRQLILHTIDLYRRGYVTQIMPVGAQANALRIALGEAGLPPEIVIDGAATGDPGTQMQIAAAAAGSAGVVRVLFVSAPAEQLVGLKILRDQGLEAYGSPPGPASTDPLAYLGAAIDYWHYALAIGERNDVVYSR